MCGALFEGPPHACDPAKIGITAALFRAGAAAIKEHARGLSDRELADTAWLRARTSGLDREPDNAIIRELARRFSILAGLPERHD